MTKQTNEREASLQSVQSDNGDRRRFLKIGAGSGAAIAATGVLGVSGLAKADDFFPDSSDPALLNRPGNRKLRAVTAANKKFAAAQQHLEETLALPAQLDNDDEWRYDDFAASFTKTLPSNEYGEVDADAFQALRRALRTGRRSHFDAIPLDPTAGRGLANPQAALKYEISALDSHATRINPSFTFRSAEIAGEVGEVYWQAVTRDVPFIDYNTDPSIAKAVADLNSFSKTPGEAANGVVTTANIFRGETPGDLVGPYISQFLLKDFKFGPADLVQRYQIGSAGVDYMVDKANWLNIQRGGTPAETASFDPVKRYIYNNRALSEYVHRDALFQAYLNACLQLLPLGPNAIDEGNPYREEIVNQGAFTSLGGPCILDMVTRAGNLSLSGAWFQKWRVHRFLRPEAFGGRIHFNMTGERSYELHPDILNSYALQEVYSKNGNYLLPQAYIEGSPTHPSYPAGHATVAGACVTVLKAFFNEDFVLQNPVQADATGTSLLAYNGVDLTVGGELNKLANNVAIGRDAAGVHYRQDGIQGLESGQQQGIALLQDYTRTFNEANFDGFTFTKFDGTRINIKNGRITEV